MKEKKIIQLINDYLDGKLSPANKAIIDKWLDSFDNESTNVSWSSYEKKELKSRIHQKLEQELKTSGLRELKKAKLPILYQFHRARNKSVVRKIFAATAVIAILLTTSWYLFYTDNTQIADSIELPSRYKNDIAPGGNKASLTLANGKTIELDGAVQGVIADQGKTKIVKVDDGQLSYTTPETVGNEEEMYYNTLSTPKGGQYELTLPDGSRVWLNSSSSITYPTLFSGIERSVEISGEVFFDITRKTIAQNGAEASHIPFIIKVNDFEVEVLGTELNIMAYNDEENVKTTLIEGAVKVRKGNQYALLEPGQQAITGPESDNIKINTNADINSVMAWKRGYFSFKRDNLETVLRQLSRWYDVDVIYTEGIPKMVFSGELQRSLNLSQILLILEKSRVTFEIDENNLIVREEKN